ITFKNCNLNITPSKSNFYAANESEFVCGGSLINNRYVLTAAHCITDDLKANINNATIRLGEWNTATDLDCETFENGTKVCADHSHLDVGIEEVIPHPSFNYKGDSTKYDIALVRLDRYVNFTDFIYPVCLPDRQRLYDKTFIGEKLDLVGWGITETNTSSLVKRVEYIEGLSLLQCRQQYSKLKLKVRKYHICAGVKQGTHTCWGDSGGPLVSSHLGYSKPKVLIYLMFTCMAGILAFTNKPCGPR
ncbi:hypothetical protein DOY81_014874, partial [Sarcophaga bullata]